MDKTVGWTHKEQNEIAVIVSRLGAAFQAAEQTRQPSHIEVRIFHRINSSEGRVSFDVFYDNRNDASKNRTRTIDVNCYADSPSAVLLDCMKRLAEGLHL